MSSEQHTEKPPYEHEWKMIRALQKRFPKRFLLVELVLIGGELFPVGLFACAKCCRPISHRQMAFSLLCGACDVGKDDKGRRWLILRPSDDPKDVNVEPREVRRMPYQIQITPHQRSEEIQE